MAGGTDFKINFTAVDKDLKKAVSELRKVNSELQKQVTLNRKNQTKADKDRTKEFNKHSKLVAKDFKQQERTQSRLFADKKKANKEEMSHFNKMRKETDKWNREQRRQGGGGFFGGGGGGGRGRGGGFGDAGRSILRAGAGVAGFAGGMLTGAASTAYQTYLQYGQALGPTIGLGGRAGGDVGRGIQGARRGNLGFSKIETAQQVPAMARATGVTGPREMQQAMRATGMDVGEVGGIFQTLRQGGTSFKGGEFAKASAGGKAFKELMSDAFHEGLEKGRLPEFFSGITDLMQKQLTISSGDVGPKGFAQVLAALHKTGLSGFQGARGAAVAGKLQEAFINPGGGEHGQAERLRAMGWGRGATLEEATLQQEEGLSDSENLKNFIAQVKREHGTGYLAGKNLQLRTGLSYTQSKDLLGLNEKDLTKAGMAKIEKAAKGIGEGSLEDQANQAMKDSKGVLERIADRTDKFITIGETFAPAIEALEDAQMAVLTKIADVLKNLYDDLKPVIEKILGVKPEEEARKAYKDIQVERAKNKGTLVEEALSEQKNLEKSRTLGEAAEDIRNAEKWKPWFASDSEGAEEEIRQNRGQHAESAVREMARAASIARRKKRGEGLFTKQTYAEKLTADRAADMLSSGKSPKEVGEFLLEQTGVSRKDIEEARQDIKNYSKMAPQQRSTLQEEEAAAAKKEQRKAERATTDILGTMSSLFKETNVKIVIPGLSPSSTAARPKLKNSKAADRPHK
jgi:hypothetical protein